MMPTLTVERRSNGTPIIVRPFRAGALAVSSAAEAASDAAAAGTVPGASACAVPLAKAPMPIPAPARPAVRSTARREWPSPVVPSARSSGVALSGVGVAFSSCIGPP
jgi:hypothetical protein